MMSDFSIPNKSSERLYLSKGTREDIYVNIQQVHEHQVKGIRFLYMNMLKETPRVILNDPPGYGKTLQIALFLSAVQHQQRKPILILCSDDEIRNWVEHFQKWTNMNDSHLAIKLTNPFINKSIHINNVENLQQFSRRDWRILVVDVGDDTKEVLKAKYKADYIIWVSNTDMKKNLHVFSSIYNWFYPKEKFVIEKFIPKKNDINDFVKKAIRLDAFFENIVLRRTDFSTPCVKTASLSTADTPLKLSRKGKDITGTKIKRSKKKSDNTSSNSNLKETSPTSDIFVDNMRSFTIEGNENINDFEARSNNTVSNVINKNTASEMDVEDFIHSQKPIEYDDFEEFNNSDNNSQNSKEDNTETRNTSFENMLINHVLLEEKNSLKLDIRKRNDLLEITTHVKN